MSQPDTGGPVDNANVDAPGGDPSSHAEIGDLGARAADRAAADYASAENERRTGRFDRAVQRAGGDCAPSGA